MYSRMDIDMLIGKLADTRMHNFNEKWDLIILLRQKLTNSPPTSIYACKPLLEFLHDLNMWMQRTAGALEDTELCRALEVATTCQTCDELVLSTRFILDFLYSLGVDNQ